MSKINVEALVAALSSDKVIEALGKVLHPLIQLSIDEAVGRFTGAIQELKKDNEEKNAKIQQLTTENAELKNKVAIHSLEVEKLEAYNRQDNLIVHGIPSTYAQAAATTDNVASFEHSTETESLFLELCNSLELDIRPSDLSICHRLPKGKLQYAPIIIRFTTRKARNVVLDARKKLKDLPGRKVFINEHLTQSAAKLSAEARKLLKEKKIMRTWTKHGQVMIKLANGSTRSVNTADDLRHL